jgi:hypothetical protein
MIIYPKSFWAKWSFVKSIPVRVVEVVDVRDPVHPQERLHLDREGREADGGSASPELQKNYI